MSCAKLEAACEVVGCSIMKVGKIWVIAKIDGLPAETGRGVFASPEEAIEGAAAIKAARKGDLG